MPVGDVVWVDMPSRGGHAQTGRRPAVIFQNERASASLSTVLVIPLTTQLDAMRFPGTVLVEQTAANGLRRTSIALVFQCSALDRRFLDGAVGRIEPAVLDQLQRALEDITAPDDRSTLPIHP